MNKFTKRYYKHTNPELDKLLQDRYADEELRSLVRKDIEERGTGDKIVKGELTLPHPRDAALHFDKLERERNPPEED